MARRRFAQEPLRDERAATAYVARKPNLPARQLEQLDCRATDLRLGEAREGISQEDDRPTTRSLLRRERCSPREPPLQRLTLETGQRTASIDAAKTVSQSPYWSRAGNPVRQRCES